MKNQLIITKRAGDINIHPTFPRLYGSCIRLDTYKEAILEAGVGVCPQIFVNPEGLAFRNIEWLMAVQELAPDTKVIICPYDTGDWETVDIIRHANWLGRKTNKVLLLEIQELKLSRGLQRGRRNDIHGTGKVHNIEAIAKILDISPSLIYRLELIYRVAPKMIDHLDNATKKGTDQKLSVSKLAEVCAKIEELAKKLDKQTAASFLEKIYTSNNNPEQFIGLLNKAQRDQKSGIAPSHTVERMLTDDSESQEAFINPHLDVESQEGMSLGDAPKFIKPVSFQFPGRGPVTANQLFTILFPDYEFQVFEKKFVKLVIEMQTYVNEHKNAA